MAEAYYSQIVKLSSSNLKDTGLEKVCSTNFEVEEAVPLEEWSSKSPMVVLSSDTMKGIKTSVLRVKKRELSKERKH